MDVVDHFLPAEAAKLARLTMERLTDWQKSGFLQASIPAKRRGVSRLYAFADVVALRVAVELRDAGVTLQMLRKVVAYLREREGLSATEVLAQTHLVTDGQRVYEIAGDAAIHIPSGQTVVQFVTIPLDQVVRDFNTTCASFGAPRSRATANQGRDATN